MLLSIFHNFIYAQHYYFDIENLTFSECLKLEQKAGSTKLVITSDYISFSGEAQPVKFLRKGRKNPNLIVTYFFYLKDSTISHIVYEWNISTKSKNMNTRKMKKQSKRLIEKHNNIKAAIIKKFGPPKKEKKSVKPDISFEEHSNWAIKDKTLISLYIISSNLHEKRGIATIEPTHRIRLSVKKRYKAEL